MVAMKWKRLAALGVRAVLMCAAAALGLHLSACSSGPQRGPGGQHPVQPSDFTGGSIPDAAAPVVAASPSTAAAPPAAPAPAPPPGKAFAVDAMVGQVNGQAIYAREVLEPIDAQLTALSRALPPSEFRRRATELVAGRINQIVTDALILGEAERDLSEGEQMGLQQYMKSKREEFLRYYGRGSVAVAEQTLQEQEGKSLDQKLDEVRQQTLIQRYMRAKMLPLINITRKDVERYYRENPAEFNPPARRQLRLIKAADAGAAQRIAAALQDGQPFAKIATDRGNMFRRDDGGLMPDLIVGDEALSGELRTAMLKLDAGQWTGPVQHEKATWFVYVEKFERPASRTLLETQLEIEQALREQRFRVLSQQYRQRLYEEGSYNELEAMVEAVLAVVASRYAAPMS
jgi:hypothetical protein